MEKMISPNGVKVNMCCASCLHLGHKCRADWSIIRWCKKKNRPIIDGHNKCGYYVMAEFFQERGYKILKD